MRYFLLQINKLILILIFINLLFSYNTKASNWKLVTTKNKIDYYIDLESIRVDGNNREFWQKDILKIEEQMPGKDVKVKYVKSHQTVNCTRGILILLQSSLFSSNHEHIETSYPKLIIPIVSNTMIEELVKYICSVEVSLLII